VTTIHITLDISRAKAGFERARPAMERAVDAKLERGAREIAIAARKGAPGANTSNLINSIIEERLGVMHWQVSENENYGRFVEEGRGPGKQPGTGNGLLEWVAFRTGLTGKPLDRATFAIARAIGRHGIAPQPYMQPAAEANLSRLFELVREGVDEGLREAFA
jgi:hypothetical protein